MIEKLPEEWRDVITQLIDLKVKKEVDRLEQHYKEAIEQAKKQAA